MRITYSKIAFVSDVGSLMLEKIEDNTDIDCKGDSHCYIDKDCLTDYLNNPEDQDLKAYI